MRQTQLSAVRTELRDYVEEVFASLPRKDQREKGNLYLQGLMLDGQRKSMQPMAERLGIDHQQLQQFTASSTQAVEPVRRRLGHLATQVINPKAWVFDDTGFAKEGTASPGVALQYSGTMGKIGNCQIAVSLHAATDETSCPLNWRLYLPEALDDTHADTNEDAARIQARRTRAGIPETVRHQIKWEQAMEMIDEAFAWGLPSPVGAADAGYGDAAGFRMGLEARGINYVVAVTYTTTAYLGTDVPETLPYVPGKGRSSLPRYRMKHQSLEQIALGAGRKQLRRVTWRSGTKTSPTNRTAVMKSRFLALRIRPANREIPRAQDGSLPKCWLLVEWPPHLEKPAGYWLSDLPGETPLRTLVRLAKMRWRIEHDYRELKTGLGLNDFEGRSFNGFHRHLTLVTAAHPFITRLRRAGPKAVGAT